MTDETDDVACEYVDEWTQERPRLKWLSILAMVAAVPVQAFLIHLIRDYARMGHGEPRGMAGMGLTMLLLAALFVIVPGTVAALYRLVRAIRLQRDEGDAQAAIAVSAAVALLPVVVWIRLVQADSPSSATSAPATNTPQDDTVAGYAWASDNGIEDPAARSTGTPAFHEGCRRYVVRATGRP
ncbi:MAG: hypothetical protein U1F52_15890 [Burkholderiales bacterium]